MYKAVSDQTGEEIIILSPYWRKRIAQLRNMDRVDELVCQGCRQPLRVKAGEVKRAHFAHKHLKACSYGSESPEILNARAVLYEWLLREFRSALGGDEVVSPSVPVSPSVTLEKIVAGADLPRPVDCWVETEAGPIAYWIIEAGIKLEPREEILSTFERLGIRVNYVLLHPMLNEKREELDSLLLTPTERAFLTATEFDAMLAGAAEPGKSLHYLEAESGTLTTYRNLVLFHAPNWYKGVKKSSRLITVRASRLDGGFVHRGEMDRLRAYRQRAARLEKKREQYQERDRMWSSRPARRVERSSLPESASGWGNTQADPLPCVICGQITSEYWSTFMDASGRRLCRCRECLERGQGISD